MRRPATRYHIPFEAPAHVPWTLRPMQPTDQPTESRPAACNMSMRKSGGGQAKQTDRSGDSIDEQRPARDHLPNLPDVRSTAERANGPMSSNTGCFVRGVIVPRLEVQPTQVRARDSNGQKCEHGQSLFCLSRPATAWLSAPFISGTVNSHFESELYS